MNGCGLILFQSLHVLVVIELLVYAQNANAQRAFEALKSLPEVQFKQVTVNFSKQSTNVNESEFLVGSATLNPIVNICDDGVPDAALQDQHGHITLFKDYHFYRLHLNGDSLTSVDNGTLTSLIYHQFPIRSGLGFSLTDSSSSLNGLSFFFRNQFAYVYSDTQFMGKISLDYWTGYSAKFTGIISERNNTIVSFIKPSSDSSGLVAESWFKIFNIIDPRAADGYERYYPPENDAIFYYIRAAMKLKDGRWLAFLQMNEVGYYCLASKLRLSRCSLIRLSTLFQCPLVLKFTRESLLLPTDFLLPSMDQDRFLFVMRGVLISILFIESILITFLYSLFVSAYTRKRLVLEVIRNGGYRSIT